jgi:arylsulfatase
LTKDGESSRRSVLNWFLTDFAAVRMDEFKAHRMVTEPLGLSRGYPGGFSGFSLPSSYLLMFNLQESPKEDDNIAIRHLWAQHLFTNEFGRFMCVLVEYPPHLPTQPNKELIFLSQIDDMREHPAKWQAACHPFEVPKKDASQ